MAAATLRVVHFRHRGLLLAGKSYSDVVAEAQSVMERPELAIGFKNRTLVCAGKAVPLQPITFAFAAWLAEQAARLGPDDAAVHWSSCDWKEFIDVHAALPGHSAGRVENIHARLEGESGENFFREQVFRLRRALRESLGSGSAPYGPRSFGRRSMTRLGFALPSSAVTVLGGAERH